MREGTKTVCTGLLTATILALAAHSPSFAVQKRSAPSPSVIAQRRPELPAKIPVRKQPDLVVRLAAPAQARAGEDIGEKLKVLAANRGGATAPGTTGTLSPANGYMIDVVLSKDTTVAPGYATYSPHYAEDVLLKGGRISNTDDLKAGAKKEYKTGGGIPANTPPGRYFICAQIDSGQKVRESNERNNVSCTRINIVRKHPVKRPDLVIRSFGLKRWGTCAPHQAVAYFEVQVANIGTAPSPANPKKALVQVLDQHNKWGNGAKLGAIPPGGSQTVLIPVYYLQSDPKHMTAQAPHPFQAIADPLKLVAESNERNNRSRVIHVGAPQGCR
jgi:hypothetical protein